MADTFTPEQITQILEEFFKVVGTRKYIGERYVPIFGRKGEESIQWDNSAPYEPLTIVLYQGDSYTSRQYVPIGVEITNQDFWVITGNYNAQVEAYHRETIAAREIADNAITTANNAQTDIDTLLPKADFSAENTVKKYIDENPTRVLAFDTVADMQADTNLIAGMTCHTNGFHASGDGGAAYYTVSANGTANGTDVLTLQNELFAHKVFTNLISTYDEFVAAIGNGNQSSSYSCKQITIREPITLTSVRQCLNKSFSNATFVLEDSMFTWATISNYHCIPNFVNCTFIGNGHSICADGAYVVRGKFVNCNFIDCSLVRNGAFVQSTRFIQCTFENAADHPIIHAKQVYDTRFISCQCESENDATLVNAFGTDTNMITTSQLSFFNCIMESQVSDIVVMHDGDVTFENCYTEANSGCMVSVLASNKSVNQIIRIVLRDCKIQPTSEVNAVNIDSSYEGSIWSSFECDNCSVSAGKLINTNNLHTFIIQNVSTNSSGRVLPSIESSKVYTAKNSIVDFSTAGHCIVKKFPCLITFDSNDGGWHTNLYLVSLSYNNTPQVVCLSDTTKAPTITYDSDTGYCDVTLHATRGSYSNCSAVLLDGLANNLVRNDYYRNTDGYSV